MGQDLKRLTPYDWQQADIDRLSVGITPAAGALIVSAPGAGKTLVATEIAARTMGETLLIIAPLSTFPSWKDTLVRQGLPEPRHLIGSEPGRAAFNDLRWDVPGTYITTPQWFAQQKWDGITPSAVIFDEIHMASKYGIKTAKALLKLRSPVRIGLSGTPFRNSFENAWVVARWIEPAAMPREFWVWRLTDCTGKYDHFAPQNWKVTGEKNEGDLVSRLSNYSIHYQRERCCSYHPEGFLAHLAEPIRLARLLPMTKNQAEFYRTMEKSMYAYLTEPNDQGTIPVIAELPITARGMLRFCALGLPSLDKDTEKLYFEDDCESPKIEALIHDLQELDGGRALVLTHSQRFAKVVTARIRNAGFNALQWSGKVSSPRRREILAEFQSGAIDVIVGVISAMATGTDGLQEATYNVMWLSVDDDPVSTVQGIGRLDRLGQKHQVVMIEYAHLRTFDVGYLDTAIARQLKLNASLKATR